MILDNATIVRLLGSIEANQLIFLCGAGLSMPAPSNLMSAVQVSRSCYDKYHAIQALPAPMRDDIDQLAGHFHASHQFQTVFINALVPWNALVGIPNEGHEAIADFLISKAVYAALSANFDPLIEEAAHAHKIAMVAALDGHEALQFTNESNPLMKFHGCLIRDRPNTLWTQAQLGEPPIQDRVRTCSEWMRLQLPGKDLIVIGFWTDWGYLNDVIADALDTGAFNSVTVIDPSDSADLRAKAPRLWNMLNAGSANFSHIRGSGGEALQELRTAFSWTWLRRFYALGRPLVEQAGLPYAAIEPDTSGEDSYRCRCDAEGKPYNLAAQKKTPSADAGQAAFFHHLLISAGANRDGAWYLLGGRRIRVINGGGQGLTSVRENYKEAPAAIQPDMVVCAGALDVPIPGSVISTGSGFSVVRPAPGAGPDWFTLEQARAELGI
jgi:hypothetical protein